MPSADDLMRLDASAGMFMGVLIYLTGLAGALALAIIVARAPRYKDAGNCFALAVGSFFVGGWMASIATPDWSPVTMAVMYTPFLAVALWMITLGFLRRAARRHSTS